MKKINSLLLVLMLVLSQALFIIPQEGFAEDAGSIDTASNTEEKALVAYTDDTEGTLTDDTGLGIDTLVKPASAIGYTITWESSDPDIATVDERGHVYGKLTGKYAGSDEATCNITATVSYKGYTASDTAKVIVKRGKFPYAEDYGFSASSLSDEQTNSGHEDDHVLAIFDSSLTDREIQQSIKASGAIPGEITSVSESEKMAVVNIKSPEKDSVSDVVDSLKDNDDVVYAQPDYTYSLNTDSDIYPYASQYMHDNAHIKGAWDLLKANGYTKNTKVGVVDTGVLSTHTDLKDNLILDADGNYMAFTDSSDDPVLQNTDYESGSHGTHVTGIIGARYDSDDTVAGVASGPDNDFSKVIVGGLYTPTDIDLTTSKLIKCIAHVADNGARVINISLGGTERDIILGKVILDYYYNHDVTFVGAAGNKESYELSDNSLEWYNHPADMKEVIAVCNHGSDGKKHASSYTGFAKDISAPGTKIYSTIRSGGFMEKNGTSMAAPVVTGICALMLDANPDLKPAEIRNMICATADERTAYDSQGNSIGEVYYQSNELGYGAVNARAAVQAAYDAKSGADISEDNPLSIKIKTPYGAEPSDSSTSDDDEGTYRTITTKNTKYSVSKPGSSKIKAGKRKITFTFKKAALVKKVTTTIDKYSYVTCSTTRTTSKATSKIKTKVKYEIEILKYGSRTSKKYKLASKSKKTSKYKAVVKGSKIKVTVSRYGKSKLKRGKYYARIRAYRKIGKTTLYSSWTKIKKVKVK